MKKKVLLITTVIAMLAIMVGGTLAYFTAEDSAQNTFTIGSVEIDVVEDFAQPNAMLPVVTVDPSDPNYVKKEAKIQNTGTNDAYVQMYVAIPKALDDVGAFVVVDTDSADWTDRVGVGTQLIDGTTYNIYLYRYTKVLAANASTDNVIEAAYMAPQLDYRDGKFIMNGVEITNYTPGTAIDIYVAAQAIQASGFDSYDAALNNFTTNPWAN